MCVKVILSHKLEVFLRHGVVITSFRMSYANLTSCTMCDVPLAHRSCSMLRHIVTYCGENDATCCTAPRGAGTGWGVNATEVISCCRLQEPLLL